MTNNTTGETAVVDPQIPPQTQAQQPQAQTQAQQPQPQTQTQQPETEENSLWRQAKTDIDKLPAWGRVILALIVVIMFFKLTPILDLLNIFLQCFVFPLMFLVALGVLSESTYNQTEKAIRTLIEYGQNWKIQKNTNLTTS